MHNELAFGTKTSPLVDEFRKGNSFLQWRSIEDLNKYQQNRLASIHDGKITEYSMLGEIAGLKVRGTFDAFDLASGTLLEFKTRARPTIPYFHEKKNKMQLLTYYFLVKNYNKELNCKDLPVEKLSEYAKIQYISQADHRLLGELVIHVPYETERYMKMMKFYKEFWLGTRRPAFSLKYCVFCKFQANCYFHKKFYHPGFYKPGKNEDRDDQA
nr:hypothetical protein [Candidatus Sigynarchaeota archaeon]